MRKEDFIHIAILLLLTTAAFGQVKVREKRAQTGMKFLSVSTDAGISAMGGAGTALEINASSMFYNPAAMAFLTSFTNFSLGRIDWIADMSYSYACAAVNPVEGRYGTIGVFAMAADYGDFHVTVRDPGESGFVDTGIFTPSAFTVGLSYAKSLSTQFSVGGNVKYVTQDLGNSIIGFDSDLNYEEKNYSENVMAFDFGVLYRTGFKSLKFGMCVRNFSREVEYEDESFQLPLIFRIGLSMDALDLFPALNEAHHSLLLSVDATHPRDFHEQLNFGFEYLFLQTVALRVGYSTPNDEHDFSAGFGLRRSFRNYMLALDYAYTPFGIFNDVHRFSLQFSL